MRVSRGMWVVVLMALVPLGAGALSVEEILKYRGIGQVEIAPDGTQAVFVVTVPSFEENVMNSDLWLVELATPLRAPAGAKRYFQLTRGLKRDSNPRWSPGSTRVAFLSNRKDKVNIWVIPVAGGEAEQVTDVKTGVNDFAWLPDGSGFIFTMTDPPTPEEEKRKKEKNDPILVDKAIKYARLYCFRFGDKEPTKLTTEDYHVNSFDISPDGHWLAFGAQPTPKVPDFRNSDLKLLNLAAMESGQGSGEIRDLVVRPGLDSGPRFSPDGSWIAFVSSDGTEDWIGNTYVCVVRPDGSGLRNISRSFDEQVGGFGGAGVEWSADGARIYFTAFERASRRLFELTVASATVRPLSSFDAQKAMGSFDLAGDAPEGSGFVIFALSGPHTPVELYRLALGPSTSLPSAMLRVNRASSNEVEKLTDINAAMAKGKIGRTEVIRYRAHDGLEVEGLLIKPVNFAEGKRYPLLVVVHGGPAGVFDLSYTPRRGAYPVQAFAEQGYLVWLPNPRGSAGFGYDYRRANYRDWGYGDYRDIMAGVDLLIARGLAEAERMGVMGWSYGGYMTSWIVTQTDRFKAASMGAGLSNLYSLFGTTDIPEALETYFGGRPWEEGQNYLRHSAMNFVAKAKTPTLIQHGQQDRRVEISQAEEFYVALKKLGVAVEMVIYPRQGHGIQEPKLVKDALERNLNWFNHWLLGIEPGAEKKKEQ